MLLAQPAVDIFLHDTYFVVVTSTSSGSGRYFRYLRGCITVPEDVRRLMHEGWGRCTSGSRGRCVLHLHADAFSRIRGHPGGTHSSPSSNTSCIFSAACIHLHRRIYHRHRAGDFLFNFFWSLKKGKPAGDNPWIDFAGMEHPSPRIR